ncbi:helix-turn-helix domain-containing protein [Streptomyces sp. NPDC014733]|uniref:helix-turn-helix domain-containing protein n=1 Tax=Streptomyces sp. NPDC014733 TaxID=3364885 RepID=UPI0036FBED98
MAEARPNVHRRRLGSALRSLRVAAGLSGEEAAAQLGLAGKAALSKIENGRQRVTGLGLVAFLSVYKVDDEFTKAKIKSLATLAASGKRTNLLDEYRGAITTDFEEYLNLEGLAAQAESYLTIVPGLLQTPAYATAIVAAGQGWSSSREVERFVALRMARQAALRRDEPIRLACILDESALRRQIGGVDDMRGQLQHLLDATEKYPHVTVQVLPFARGAHAGIDNPFQVLHFPSGPPVVVVDTMTTSLYLEEDGDIERYETALDHLRAQALDSEASRRFIHEIIQD